MIIKRKDSFDYQAVEGDYQYRALLKGARMQRFWHTGKLYAWDVLTKPYQQSLRSTKIILEVGCGAGLLLQHIAVLSSVKIGVDINFHALQFLKYRMSELSEKKSATGLYFSLQSKGETLPLESASFNWVLLSEVIEHLADPSVLVNEIYRVLKPGGFLYLTTPNYASHWPFLEKFIDLIGKAPKMAGEQHISPFTPDSLRLLLKSWTIELLTSFYRFSPFYAQISFKLAKRVLRRELSVENKHGMLLVCIARKNGLQ